MSKIKRGARRKRGELLEEDARSGRGGGDSQRERPKRAKIEEAGDRKGLAEGREGARDEAHQERREQHRGWIEGGCSAAKPRRQNGV